MGHLVAMLAQQQSLGADLDPFRRIGTGGHMGPFALFVVHRLHLDTDAFRWVVTEQMTGMDHPPTTNDLSLVEEDGATLLTILVEYPDMATRDMILATGMVDGMERSFERLDEIVG